MRWAKSFARCRPHLAPHSSGAALPPAPGTRSLPLVILLALAAVLSGCGDVSRLALPAETGALHVVTPLSALQAEGFTGAKMRLTQGNLVRELLLDVSGSVVAGTVDNLPVGEWKVTLDLYDPAGDITHSATGTVRVRPGETTALTLEVKPKEGVVEIVADISGFSEPAAVERVRIVFHNNQSSTLERASGHPMLFQGVKSLNPGDYDYRIELYGATLYAADRLYQSPWESVRVHPGKTVRVTWQAASGAAYIETVISRMPDPPGQLRLERDDSRAYLAWSASADPEVASYRIYVKDDEFSSFSLREETPASELVWSVPASILTNGAWVAVTAARADKRESFRSNVVYIPPESQADI